MTMRFERADPGGVRPDAIDIEFSTNGITETERFVNEAGGWAMNPIEDQRRIIDELYWLIKDSLTEDYDTASCHFDYQRFKDSSASIGARLSYSLGGETKYGILLYPDRQMLDIAIPQLHALMKAHTGGDWHAFTLSIDKEGQVVTKFEYSETSSLFYIPNGSTNDPF